MPIYDYVCANGHVTEVIHGVSEPGPAACPICGGVLRKAVSAAAVHFKGSGWAKNERNAKPAPAKSAGSAKSTEPSASSGDTSKAETPKPASTASSEAT